MSLHHGTKIVTSGLVLMLDASNIKSFPGEPTTNYAYLQNPRIDSSYSAVDLSSYGGTMVANHPGVIQAYDVTGSAFNAVYYNGGVGDPTNSQHAYWIYDSDIKKPVVQMIDKVGGWQAKSYGLSMNAWSTYGYGVGTQYTISWMQWTTHLSKRADVGLYTSNSLNSYNFWDGRSDGSVSSTNTKTYTWEKVYHTFTVTSNWDQTKVISGVYMYGMSYINGQTVRITDVQFEIKGYPTQFLNGLTRGITVATGGGLKDISGNNNHAELTTGITFNSKNAGVITTDTTNGYMIVQDNASLRFTDSFTQMMWVQFNNTVTVSYKTLFGKPSYINYGMIVEWGGNNLINFDFTDTNSARNIIGIVPPPQANLTWNLIGHTYDKNAGANNHVAFIINSGSSTFSTGTSTLSVKTDTSNLYIGNAGLGVNIGPIYLYNKALSTTEILQNYNTTKGRYGL